MEGRLKISAGMVVVAIPASVSALLMACSIWLIIIGRFLGVGDRLTSVSFCCGENQGEPLAGGAPTYRRPGSVARKGQRKARERPEAGGAPDSRNRGAHSSIPLAADFIGRSPAGRPKATAWGSWGRKGKRRRTVGQRAVNPRGTRGNVRPCSRGAVGPEWDRRRTGGPRGRQRGRGPPRAVVGLFQRVFQQPVRSAFFTGFRGGWHVSRNQVPRKGLRVRVPCPPLRTRKVHQGPQRPRKPVETRTFWAYLMRTRPARKRAEEGQERPEGATEGPPLFQRSFQQTPYPEGGRSRHFTHPDQRGVEVA